MPIYMNILDKKGGKQLVTGTGTGKYLGWVELDSCQLGVHRSPNNPPGRGTNRESSEPAISEIVVTKSQDTASTALFKLALSSAPMWVQIDFVVTDKAGASVYMSVELENTIISSFSAGGGHGALIESLSLNFTKVTFVTAGAPPDKKAARDKAVWNLAAGTPQ